MIHKFEMTDNSWFRITLLDDFNKEMAHSDWTSFTGVASLEFAGKKYIAVSQYFDDGVLPTEQVLELNTVPKQIQAFNVHVREERKLKK